MTKQLITIDDLAGQCGYFLDSEDADPSNGYVLNNGYLCTHPENAEGCCLRTACPIATRATMRDIWELDWDLWQTLEESDPTGEEPPQKTATGCSGITPTWRPNSWQSPKLYRWPICGNWMVALPLQPSPA